jgi:hypothetical protein
MLLYNLSFMTKRTCSKYIYLILTCGGSKQIIDIWHGVLAMTPQSHTVPWYKPHPFTFGFEYGTIHIPDNRPCLSINTFLKLKMSIICLWYKTYTPRAKQTRPSDS